MRVGVNTLFMIPGEVGGAETYLRESLKALAERPDIVPVVFTNRENDAALREDLAAHSDAEFHRLDVRAVSRPWRIVAEQTSLPRRAGLAVLDVLWSPGYTAPLFCRVPQVVSVLDMQYKRHPEDLSVFARLATDVLVRGGCRRCDGVVAISEFSRREILRFTSASSDRVFVAQAGVSRRFITAGGDAGAPRSVAGDRPYMLCVANSYPHKNLPALVTAFMQVADDLPHRLVLVGRPRRGETELRRALQTAADRVVRIESVDVCELARLYFAADVFVLPSLYEGFGLPVLEAMAAGVPVVTTRCASLPEVGGEHAVYADPPVPEALGECLRGVCNWSGRERARRVSAGREWARRFTWQRSVDALCSCFSAALDNAKRRPAIADDGAATRGSENELNA